MSPADPTTDRPSGDGLPAPGDVIDGRYRIDEKLGSGGMGAVFAAHDTARNRPVAVKIMLAHEARHQDAAKRFMREARAARAIDHEHVAQVFDAGTAPSGVPYIVMERLVGRTLDKLIGEQAPLPIPLAVDYLLQICEGVAQAHALGIIHRDLKPSNLYLTHRPEGTAVVKVLDFGIAKATVQLDPNTEGISLTESSSTLGSPQYMSPEQLRCAKSVDVRTDIWSLGLILHKMLTGRAAFDADNLGSQFAMIISDPPTRLGAHLSDAPLGLEELILCCLEKNVAHRYQDLGQLAEALLPFAPGSGERVQRIRRGLDRAGASSDSWPERSSRDELEAAPRSDSLTTLRWRGDEHESTTRSAGAASQPTAGPRRRGWPLGGTIMAILGLAAGGYYLVARAPADGSGHPTEERIAAVDPAEPNGTGGSEGSPSHEAPAAASVEIKLTLVPPDARVELEGALTEANPIELPLAERSYVLVVSAPGFVSERREVFASRNAQLEIHLDRARPVAPAAGGPGEIRPTAAPSAPVSTTAPSTVPQPAPTTTPTNTPLIEPKGPLEDIL